MNSGRKSRKSITPTTYVEHKSMSKRSRRQQARVARDPSAETSKQINQRHEQNNQPYGQFSDDEKVHFTGRCGLDILAAVSMAEQVANGDEAVLPGGIDLPTDYLANPAAAAEAFEILSKSARNHAEVLVGCMTCCNTVGVNTETAAVIGQQMCQKYCKSGPIQF